MSYLDESEYDDRSRDDRSRDERSREDRSREDRSRDDRSRDDRARDPRDPSGRRASQPARPAWDAATYGTPDDLRRTRPPASPSSPRGRGYSPEPPPPDPYRSPYSTDPYSTDPYSPDPYPPGPAAPDPYPPDPYAPSAYAAPDPYATGPYQADPYAPSAYPPEGYGTEPARHSSSFPDDLYPAASTASPYAPAYPDSEPRPPTSLDFDPYAASLPPDPYLGPHSPDPYSPDPYLGPQSPDPYAGGQTDEPGGFPLEPVSGRPSRRRAPTNGGGPDLAEQYPGGMASEDSGAPEPSGGKAGRNLPAAIAVGVLLGGIALASLLVWRPAFLGVLVVAVGVGVWELVRAIRTSDANPPLIPLVAGGALMMGLAWWGHGDALTFGLMVTVLAAMVWRLADGSPSFGRDIAAATLVAVYLPFLAGFAALLATPADGDRRVLVTLAGVVLSDTGGYIAGVLFGRHPMAPSVSPKKSWEGLVGSLVATAVGGALLLHFLFHVSFAWGAVFGLAVCVAAVLGDLGESMLKRDLGVKDMSHLLPGHGGLMDRLDSILLAAPTAYVLLLFLAPPL